MTDREIIQAMMAADEPEEKIARFVERARAGDRIRALGFKPDKGGGYVRPGKKRLVEGTEDPSLFQQIIGNISSRAEIGDAFARMPSGESYAGDVGRTLAGELAGVNENFAFGLPAKAMDIAGLGSPENRARIRSGSVMGGKFGDVVGMAASGVVGPEAAIAKGVDVGSRALQSAVPVLKSTGAGRVLSGLISGAAGSGAVGMSEGLSRGETVGDAADRALEYMTVGAPVGTAGALFSEAASAGQRKLRDPRTLRGRTIEEFNKAKESGAFDQEKFKKLQSGKPGYYEVADEIGQAFTETNQAKLKDARAQYGKGLADVIEKSGGRAIPLDDVHARLRSLDEGNIVNGVVADEGLAKAVDKTRMMLSRDVAGERMGVGTLEDLIKTKRLIERKADFGALSTTENAPYRLIYKEIADAASSVDPKLAKLNAKYGETISKLERANDIVYGRDAPDIVGRASAERTAAARLARLGDETTAGSVGERQLQELRALDPDYAKLLDDIATKKAYERTRFGLPRMSASPENWGVANVINQNLNSANTRIADPVLSGIRAVPVTDIMTRTINPLMRGREKERELAKKLKKN